MDFGCGLYLEPARIKDNNKEKISTQRAQKSQRTTEKSAVLFPSLNPLLPP
jgi:hypothetical protein